MTSNFTPKGTIRHDVATFFVQEFNISKDRQDHGSVERVLSATGLLTPDAQKEVVDLVCDIAGIERPSTAYDNVKRIEDEMVKAGVTSDMIDLRNMLEGMEDDLTADISVVFNRLVADGFVTLDGHDGEHAWSEARDNVQDAVEAAGYWAPSLDDEEDDEVDFPSRA